MPCEWLKTNDGGMIHINRGRGGAKPKICPFCKSGEVRISEHLTRLNDTIDVCPIHRGQAVMVEGKILAHD